MENNLRNSLLNDLRKLKEELSKTNEAAKKYEIMNALSHVKCIICELANSDVIFNKSMNYIKN